MKRYSLAFLGVAFCLAGCGGSTSSTSGNSGITGNWELTLTNGGVPSYGTASYGIYLTQTGSAVSGIMLGQQGYPDCWAPPAPPCAFPFGTLDPVLAGTIDAAGNIALASDPAYPGASLSITASTTGTALGGTYSTTLVTTSPPGTWSNQGTISGIEIGVLNGTYGGTLKSSVTGLSMGITTTLRQRSSPDPDGYLEISGSANFTGWPCFTSATIPTSNPGLLSGNFLGVDLIPTNSPIATVVLSGTLSTDTKTIVATYLVNGGTCDNEDLGSGTLTLQ